ncbi:NAD(P)/FAD-dependent oxidoreductase [Belnapia sp. T18]|uniref:NAD(P)/FAD-dependent oxidoreductase n=1 Tax=Belnapia arida TaxID=2804533 RepID=A0ABS1U184_9PROT|nr:NAD(P)/FAD-dependent oxidoreductase [Belnapia arida]MBL6078448.1 NAD(P)/FAD-dependent oxidoreductase [Belnapia arida]
MPETRIDAVIVGAGFAGMYMLHRLRGLGIPAVVLEQGEDVGGTWYWNRYPGARCDVESMQYSFSFLPELQQEWSWSERFASQPEILRYAAHVAERLDLRRDIRFHTRVTRAAYDEANALWTVETDGGDRYVAQYCVMATGCLSTARLPEIAGLESFQGATYHTGHWPHEGVDFSGKRVGVIGTGSSAIQAIPVIARQAAQLTVFQRTPNFSIPSRNAPMDDDYESWWKSDYAAHRAKARMMRTGILYGLNDKSALEVTPEEREAEYEARWARGGTAFMGAFSDLITNREANDTAAEFVRRKIRGMVKDPKVAEILAPKGYPIGTKRICVDTEYFETFNRPNVALVDVREAPIEAIIPRGVRTRSGEHEFDALVFATGFDAMTGALTSIDIRGRDDLGLAEAWAEGPRTYLGLMAAGFPNLFMITGPGSPSVLSNMIVSIEQHVDWLSDCLAHMRARGLTTIEATPEAQEAWVAHGSEVAERTLYPQAASWYMGANVPGKPRVFMPYIGGVGTYREKCAEIAAKGYEGFRLSAGAMPAAAAE